MQGLGLNDNTLESLILQENLFKRFERPCLANAIFSVHFPFLGGSYVEKSIPHIDRDELESGLLFRGKPVILTGVPKYAFAELFTLAEINQNIFVFVAQQVGLPMRNWNDVRQGRTLTSSMTHELEGEFNVSLFGEEPLPLRTPEEAALVLTGLSSEHDFTFYKYSDPGPR
jgi:hypothetical protein